MLVGVMWYLVVLICISLLTNDAEHLFMFLLATYIFFEETSIFRLSFLLLSYKSSLYMLDTRPLSEI